MGAVVRGDVGSGQGRGVPFQQGQDAQGVGKGLLIDGGDPGAGVGLVLHQPLGLQATDGLPHGDGAGAELPGEGVDDQAEAGAIGAGQDALPDGAVAGLLFVV